MGDTAVEGIYTAPGDEGRRDLAKGGEKAEEEGGRQGRREAEDGRRQSGP